MYTLIATKTTMGTISIPFLDRGLCYNGSQSKYIYRIKFGAPPSITLPAIADHYFWDVYPKLNSNYKITFEVVIAHED